MEPDRSCEEKPRSLWDMVLSQNAVKTLNAKINTPRNDKEYGRQRPSRRLGIGS